MEDCHNVPVYAKGFEAIPGTTTKIIQIGFGVEKKRPKIDTGQVVLFEELKGKGISALYTWNQENPTIAVCNKEEERTFIGEKTL